MPERFVVQPRAVPAIDGARVRVRGAGEASATTAATAARPPRGALDRHPVLEPIARYLEDPDVTDLFINGSTGLFVDRGEGPRARPGGAPRKRMSATSPSRS